MASSAPCLIYAGQESVWEKVVGQAPHLLRYVRVAPVREKALQATEAIRGAGQASPILLAFFLLLCTPAPEGHDQGGQRSQAGLGSSRLADQR